MNNELKTWKVVAFADSESGLPRREATVVAATHKDAIIQGQRIFPEYHEIGAFSTYG